MSALGIPLDIAVLVALIATLVRAVRLERALQVMRTERGAWEVAVGGLGAGTREAQAGLIELRTAADGAAREVAAQAGRADGLRDDLTFLIGRADTAADRLEQAVRASRPNTETPAPRARAAPAFEDVDMVDATDRGALERELLAALRRSR